MPWQLHWPGVEQVSGASDLSMASDRMLRCAVLCWVHGAG
jgi:hypothetical protein